MQRPQEERRPGEEWMVERRADRRAERRAEEVGATKLGGTANEGLRDLSLAVCLARREGPFYQNFVNSLITPWHRNLPKRRRSVVITFLLLSAWVGRMAVRSMPSQPSFITAVKTNSDMNSME